jgi:hypothetical protein
VGSRKVVFVDFGKRRRGSRRAGGTALLFWLFLSLVGSEILLAAVLLPSSIGSSFFGPTVVVVAVALALGCGRLLGRERVPTRGPVRESDHPGDAGPTLH